MPLSPLQRKRRVFIAITIIFTLVMLGFTIDIFRKTSPPGSKKHLPESILPAKE